MPATTGVGYGSLPAMRFLPDGYLGWIRRSTIAGLFLAIVGLAGTRSATGLLFLLAGSGAVRLWLTDRSSTLRGESVPKCWLQIHWESINCPEPEGDGSVFVLAEGTSPVPMKVRLGSPAWGRAWVDQATTAQFIEPVAAR